VSDRSARSKIGNEIERREQRDGGESDQNASEEPSFRCELQVSKQLEFPAMSRMADGTGPPLDAAWSLTSHKEVSTMDTLLFHPKLVHVPMALGVLMPIIAGGLLLAWWRNWLPRRGWFLAIALQAILVGSGVLALQSGEVEEERVERFVAERLIEQHEQAAEAFVWASGGVLAAMILAAALGSRRAGLPIAAAAALGTLLVLGLGYRTGQAGGGLVYEHGAAQAYSAAGAAARAPGRRDDDD
jgi:hypothetical protein